MDSPPTNKDLSLELLTKKLCTLPCFLSGHQSQSIGKHKIEKSILSHWTYTFYTHQHPLMFNTYLESSKLCIIDCLQEHRSRTDLVRENFDGNPQELILSYAYPFKPINSQSITSYIKLFLAMVGIDITVFTIHSIHSASTSKARNIGLSIKHIQKAACWKGSSTFRKHYKLPIRTNFGDELVNAFIK